MKPKTKKIWTIVLSVFALIFVLLLTLPFAFRGKIMEIAKQELNKQLTAEVDFKKLNLSFIRNFPNASISLKDVYIAGKDDFAGDTLLISKDISLVVNLKSIFSDSGYDVKKIYITDSKVLAHVLKDGRANWDIFPSDTTEVDTTESNFNFKLKDVKIAKADVIYLSDSGNVAAQLKNLNVKLKGDFTSEHTLLNTQFTIDTLNFWSGGVRYVHDMTVDFKADIDAVLKDDLYTFANNEIKLNAIPLSLNGWVQLFDEGMDMDLKLNTDRVDFKSLLSLIPAIYSNSFADIKADGKVSLNGFAKGKMVDEDYPAFELKLDVENGKFQYPSLPKSVDNIQIASNLSSPGGSLDNTVVDVSKFSFNMAGSPFSGKLHIVTPLSDPDFKLSALGKLNLGIIKDVYPLDKGTELNGVLDMDVNAAGKMSWIEKNQYENFKFGGKMNVKDMLVKMADLGQDVRVNNANLLFNDRYLDLTDLNLKIGRNDLSANGKVENYLAYALRDMMLKGDFKISSNYMNITDFMSGDEEENDTSSMSVIKIPKNLNLNLAGDFKELVYDKMNFKNANGQLKVADGELNIQKMNVNAFGGNMALIGKYSSANPLQPAVDFDIDMQQISFAEIFSQVESLQKFVPIFEKLAGRFNTKLSLNTLLAGDMMPILSSIISNGNFKAEAITLKQDVSAFQELAKSLKMDNKLSNFSLKDIALAFEIKDGKLNTKPFDLKFKDYAMNIGGTTGLDQSIAYLGTVKLPDKLNLGKFQNVGFKIGGTFTKPKVELDLKNTLTSLVDEQKDMALKKVDSAKNVALDKGRAERDRILQDAQRRADAILEQAKQQGDRLVREAQVRSDSLVSKAANPVAKALAKKGADELVKQAQKQADNLNNKARAEADRIIKEAEEKSKF
ncbi:MAG TPA: AsmA family protein [Bacteroidales bacterium]|nr:AsmA family protein [Bacteroidales bacterium]